MPDAESKEKAPDAGQPLFLAYAAGNAGVAILRQVPAFFVMFFYCPPVGAGTVYLEAQQASLAIFLAKLVDSVTDPVVGYFSDRTNHRWGRRLPYMMAGAPLWILFTILLFAPPTPEPSTLNLVWLAAVLALNFTAMTLFHIPYVAVLPEITRTPDHTLRVASKMGMFFIAGVLLVLATGFPLAGQMGFAPAMGVFSVIAGAAFLAAMGQLFRTKQVPVPARKDPLLRTTLDALKQRPFVAYLAGHSLFMIGYYLMLIAAPYFVQVIVGMPLSGVGALLLLAMVVAIAASPLVERLARHYEKKAVMLAAMAGFAALYVFWFFVGKLPALEGTATVFNVTGFDELNAKTVRFGVLCEALLFFGFAGLIASVQMLLPNAIVADLVAYDRKATGISHEAVIYGLQGAIEKFAVMGSVGISGLCLALGKDAANPQGIYMLGLAAAGCCALGFFVFLWYPLGKGWQERLDADEVPR